MRLIVVHGSCMQYDLVVDLQYLWQVVLRSISYRDHSWLFLHRVHIAHFHSSSTAGALTQLLGTCQPEAVLHRSREGLAQTLHSCVVARYITSPRYPQHGPAAFLPRGTERCNLMHDRPRAKTRVLLGKRWDAAGCRHPRVAALRPRRSATASVLSRGLGLSIQDATGIDMGGRRPAAARCAGLERGTLRPSELTGCVLHTPVAGRVSATVRAPSASPVSAQAMERTCS